MRVVLGYHRKGGGWARERLAISGLATGFLVAEARANVVASHSLVHVFLETEQATQWRGCISLTGNGCRYEVCSQCGEGHKESECQNESKTE